jgi:V8-like Glu-specific endopeptidase
MNIKYLALTLLTTSAYAGIFGPDSRLETRETMPSEFLELARSSAALVPKENTIKVEGGLKALGTPLSRLNFCEDIAFSEQRIVANCSASLIAPDIILTAAHCFDSKINRGCKDYSIVFDYVKDSTLEDEFFFPDENVYNCKEILYNVFDTRYFTEDLALIKLDRVVKGRTPIQIEKGPLNAGDELIMIGHPLGIFQKYVDGGEILKVEKERLSFKHNLDTFSVNSGGPIFNPETKKQVGVLVRGTSPNQTKREGSDCYDWGVARDNDFIEGNLLHALPFNP